MKPNCNQIRCAFRENCRRFNLNGSDTPILMFLPDGIIGDHSGELDGCSDFWPKIPVDKRMDNEFKNTPSK